MVASAVLGWSFAGIPGPPSCQAWLDLVPSGPSVTPLDARRVTLHYGITSHPKAANGGCETAIPEAGRQENWHD